MLIWAKPETTVVPGTCSARSRYPTARGLLFDFDGGLTRTAQQNAAARKAMLNEFLTSRARDTREAFVPCDSGADYNASVEGKPRRAATRGFLASRRIELTTGTPEDPAETPTVHGLPNHTNNLVLKLIDRQGVTVYPGSVRHLHTARDTGLPCAVVMSRANARHVLTDALRAHGADVVLGDLDELLDRR